jgi:dTDP-4-amino-4,6-dideoxygalactose transaminase
VSVRAQPPVRSPLTLGAIGAGLRAAAEGGATQRATVSRRIADQFAASAVALTDSGTSALALALRLAAARRPGRPVLLPAWGCYDLATASDAADLPVAFYDLDPVTLGPSWESLGRALLLEPAAAVAAHFYGVPVDWPRFARLTSAAGAVPIEDAAQGAGGSASGRPLGGSGDLAVLSFGRGKGVTGGKGGALLAHGETWLSALASLGLRGRLGTLRDLVVLVAQWLLTRPRLYGLPAGLPWLGLGQTVYNQPHPAEGLTALAAGVLTVTMRLAPAEAAARRRHAEILLRGLERVPCGLVTPPPDTQAGWLRMPVRLTSRDNSGVNADPLARSLGIYQGYPMVLGDLPGFGRRVVAADEPVPGARELARTLVTLPTHGALTESDLERAVRWVGGEE